MGPIFKADLRPRRPRGVQLEQELIYYVSYTETD